MLTCLALVLALADDKPKFTRDEDVIYGRKFGVALTMDVFRPAKPNGAGVIFCVSGGWYSTKESISPAFCLPFVQRGYTVFAVVHGSQPKFSIPEVVADMRRAVRYIRANATKYQIDPDKLGVCGASAGGHLSCTLGVAEKPGKPEEADKVEREPCKVKAVACFFPPTDFLNYGKPGEEALGNGVLAGFKAPFDFVKLDYKTKSLALVTDPEERRKIGKEISPTHQANAKSAPTLIVHGDADKLVPIQQAELFIDALKKAGVPAELVVKKGAGHGWGGLDKDLLTMADWFDKYVK